MPSKITLMLLPGLMCDDAFWAPLTPLLAPGFEPVVADYGDAASITAMAQAVLDRAPPQFAVAGHSMGGRVAIEVARLSPRRVLSLALLCSGYLPLATGDKGQAERAGRMALLQVAREQGVPAMARQWVKDMVRPDRLGEAALVDPIIAMFARKSADRFALQLQALLTRPDGSPTLAQLAMPTGLLAGRHDGWAPVSQHQAMLALVPKGQLAVVEDSGHMLFMESPQASADLLNQFLTQAHAPL